MTNGIDWLIDCLFGAWHRPIGLGSLHTQHPDPSQEIGQPIALRRVQKKSNGGDICSVKLV